MSMVEYTAVDRGELVSGHTDGVVYYIDFDATEINPSRLNIKDSVKALDGTTKTTLYRQEKRWQVTTKLITRGSSSYNSWVEFLNSVIGGEAFTFDATGAYASPVNQQTVIMEGDYSESREGTTNYFRFSFEMRVI